VKDWPPLSITTDKLASYQKAIGRLKRDGKLASDAGHRHSKCLCNII
jgi:transposase-like protein